MCRYVERSSVSPGTTGTQNFGPYHWSIATISYETHSEMCIDMMKPGWMLNHPSTLRKAQLSAETLE